MKNGWSRLRTCSSLLTLVLLVVTRTGYGADEVSIVLPFKKTAAVKIEHTADWVSACQAEYASWLQSQYPNWLSIYNNNKDRYCTEYLYTFGATVRNISNETVLDIAGNAVATDNALRITQPSVQFGDLPAQTEIFVRNGFKLRANGLLQLAALPVEMSLTFRTDNPLNAPDFPVNTWVEVASLPTPGWTRQSHSSMVVNSRSGSLLVFGSDTHGRSFDNAVHEFDTQRLRWTTHHPPTTLDSYQVDTHGQAISGSRDKPQPWAMHTYDEVVYDPTVGQLVVTAIDPHNYSAYDKVPNATYHPTWLYDLASHSWRTFVNYGNSDPLRVPNFFARAAEYDERRDVIWAVRSKELWFIDRNRAAWVKVPAAAPVVQAHVNMVRDSKRDQLIVFGQYSRLTSDILVYAPALNPAANGNWQIRRPGGELVVPDDQIPAAYDDEQGVFLLLPSRHTTATPTDTVVYDPANNIYVKVPGTSLIQGAHVNPLNFMLQYHPARKMFLLVTGRSKMPTTVWAFKLDYGRLMSP